MKGQDEKEWKGQQRRIKSEGWEKISDKDRKNTGNKVKVIQFNTGCKVAKHTL